MQDNFYEPHAVTNPSRPFIYHKGSFCCMPHWHEKIELLLFGSNGEVVRDRTSYKTEKNDIVIFGSNMLHGVRKHDGTIYDCLIVDGKFCAENNIDISALDFQCIIRDETAVRLFREAEKEIEDFDLCSPELFSAAGTKSSILALLVYLCRKYSRPIGAARERGESVKLAIGYINSRILQPMTIDEIAGYVKVSKYYFCRKFRRETGYTIVGYINNLRCREAEKILNTGEATVSEAARLCGYNNLSYFTRIFKSIIGKSPSEIKNSKK